MKVINHESWDEQCGYHILGHHKCAQNFSYNFNRRKRLRGPGIDWKKMRGLVLDTVQYVQISI
jgi:hypothetical protein